MWVGIPYEDNGRTLAGLDCWGLLKMYMEKEAGLDLPLYSDVSARDLIRVSRLFRSQSLDPSTWKLIEGKPQKCDAVVLRTRTGKVEAHCGVMVDSRNMLHTEKATGSVIVPIRMQIVRNRIIRICRHVSLM